MKAIQLTLVPGTTRNIKTTFDNTDVTNVTVTETIDFDFAINKLVQAYGGCRTYTVFVADSTVASIELTCTSGVLGNVSKAMFIPLGVDMHEDTALNESALNYIIALT